MEVVYCVNVSGRRINTSTRTTVIVCTNTLTVYTVLLMSLYKQLTKSCIVVMCL